MTQVSNSNDLRVNRILAEFNDRLKLGSLVRICNTLPARSVISENELIPIDLNSGDVLVILGIDIFRNQYVRVTMTRDGSKVIQAMWDSKVINSTIAMDRYFDVMSDFRECE